jgi:hypothetical protein
MITGAWQRSLRAGSDKAWPKSTLVHGRGAVNRIASPPDGISWEYPCLRNRSRDILSIERNDTEFAAQRKLAPPQFGQDRL